MAYISFTPQKQSRCYRIILSLITVGIGSLKSISGALIIIKPKKFWCTPEIAYRSSEKQRLWKRYQGNPSRELKDRINELRRINRKAVRHRKRVVIQNYVTYTNTKHITPFKLKDKIQRLNHPSTSIQNIPYLISNRSGANNDDGDRKYDDTESDTKIYCNHAKANLYAHRFCHRVQPWTGAAH